LRFTQAVVLQRGNVRDEALQAVRQAGFSDADIIEIVANIALNIFTNYLNLVSNPELDFPCSDRNSKARAPQGTSAPTSVKPVAMQMTEGTALETTPRAGETTRYEGTHAGRG
jgi:hypothetical protein